MSVDKLVDSTQLDADLTSVANAIRAKGGTSAQLAFPAGFVSAVEAIPTGGGDPNQNLVAVNNNTLTSFSDQTIQRIRPYMFYGNTALVSLSVPAVTSIGTYAFYKCGVPGALSFALFLTVMESNAFREMPNLTYIVFKGGVFRLDASVFEKCTSLSVVDIGDWGNKGILNINPGAFYNTANLRTLVIRGGAVFPLGGTFPTTAGLSTGTIYVPASLVNSYKTATNWSNYAAQILPIEGSIYETQYADGTPIT